MSPRGSKHRAAVAIEQILKYITYILTTDRHTYILIICIPDSGVQLLHLIYFFPPSCGRARGKMKPLFYLRRARSAKDETCSLSVLFLAGGKNKILQGLWLVAELWRVC
jgi:hypothetical protein